MPERGETSEAPARCEARQRDPAMPGDARIGVTHTKTNESGQAVHQAQRRGIKTRTAGLSVKHLARSSLCNRALQ